MLHAVEILAILAFFGLYQGFGWWRRIPMPLGAPLELIIGIAVVAPGIALPNAHLLFTGTTLVGVFVLTWCRGFGHAHRSNDRE